MLNFLRKYQKVVFGAVTGALVISMTFFGSYGAISRSPSEIKDEVISKGIDGSKISKLHIEQLKRFILTDGDDIDFYHTGSMPNLFNKGVIKQEIFAKGLALMVAEAYFDEIQDQLNERLEKQKKFKGYQHPAAPFISAENLYTQFLPELSQLLKKIRSEDFTVSKESLKDLFALHEQTYSFPTEYVRRFLSYQQNQYDWIAKDPELSQGDLSLFKFHSLEDWFGSNFSDLLAQVIYNGALLAKKEGIEISYGQARENLIKNGYESLKRLSNEEPSVESLDQLWNQFLKAHRLSEKEAVTLWQEILLFQKVLELKGSSVLVDAFSQKEFDQFVSLQREVAKYEIAYDFKIKSFDELMEFEVYQDAVCEKKSGGILGLSDKIKNEEKLLESYPELFEKTYDLEFASLNLNDLAANISLKKVWDWQLVEENFTTIKSKFPKAEAGLDRLEDSLREQIDRFSALEILKSDKALIAEKLSEIKKEKKSLRIAQDFSKKVVDGIDDLEAFTSILEEKKELDFYSQNGIDYLSVKLISASEKPRLLTFKEASHQKILKTFVDKKLQSVENEFRLKNPSASLKEDGSKKAYEAIRSELGAYAFKSLLAALEKKVDLSDLSQMSVKEKLDHLAKYRYVDFVHSALVDIQTKGADAKILKKGMLPYIEKSNVVVKRKQMESWMDEEIFSKEDSFISSVKTDPISGTFFYETLGASYHDQEEIDAKVKARQTELATEAKKEFFSNLVRDLKQKQIISLHHIRE